MRKAVHVFNIGTPESLCPSITLEDIIKDFRLAPDTIAVQLEVSLLNYMLGDWSFNIKEFPTQKKVVEVIDIAGNYFVGITEEQGLNIIPIGWVGRNGIRCWKLFVPPFKETLKSANESKAEDVEF